MGGGRRRATAGSASRRSRGRGRAAAARRDPGGAPLGRVGRGAAPAGGWAGLDPTAYTLDADDAAAAGGGGGGGGAGGGPSGVATRPRRDLDGDAQAKVRRYKEKLWRAQRDASYAVKTPVIEWKLGYVYWKHGHMEQPTAQRFVASGGVMPDV